MCTYKHIKPVKNYLHALNSYVTIWNNNTTCVKLYHQKKISLQLH